MNPTSKLNLWEAHNQWANRPADQRFQTLEALRESVHTRRMASRSVDIDITGMKATGATSEDGKPILALNGKITPCEPSHWALGQFAGMLGAPASYLRTLPQPILIDCLNHGLEKTARDTMKFMTITREDSEVNTLQAVTSPTYGRIWDADVADAAQRIVERTNGRFYNPRAYASGGQGNALGGTTVPSGLYASDRDIFIFMIDGGSLLDVGPRAQLNRGFFLWNSEVGAKTFGITTFLFNQCCGNHIVWGAQDVNTMTIRHTKNGPYRFDSEAAPLLMNYVNSSAAPIEDAVKKAMNYKLPVKENSGDFAKPTLESIGDWLAKGGHKFTKAEVRSAIDFAKAEDGDCATLWDFVQGATAYARGFEYIDARVDLENRAGKLLKMVE